jgi:hypothetical protein
MLRFFVPSVRSCSSKPLTFSFRQQRYYVDDTHIDPGSMCLQIRAPSMYMKFKF